MDVQSRRKLLTLLAFQMFMFYCLEQTSSASTLAIHYQLEEIQAFILLIACLRARRKRPRSFWARERIQGSLETHLFSSFNSREFKARMRVSYETFQYLCSNLAPSLQKQETRFRSAIPLETRVAIGLSRLATGSTLQVVADLYSIGLSTCHMIFVQFLTSLNSLKANYVRWPSSSRMREIASDFERLHGIPT